MNTAIDALYVVQTGDRDLCPGWARLAINVGEECFSSIEEVESDE